LERVDRRNISQDVVATLYTADARKQARIGRPLLLRQQRTFASA
jgi:hypothetical protein